MTFCSQCGTQRDDAAQFCGKCGASASGSAAGAAPAAPAYSAPTGYGEQIPTIVTLALVFAFFSPLIGLILAYVGKAQAQATGPLSVKRNNLALTLSWVFLAVGIVFAIIYFVAMGALISSSYYY